jgi:hypothetical protein
VKNWLRGEDINPMPYDSINHYGYSFDQRSRDLIFYPVKYLSSLYDKISNKIERMIF